MVALPFNNKNRQTLISYSMHYIRQPFNFFYKNYYIRAIFLMLFPFHKFAFSHIIYIFNIIHNSLNVKCYELNVDTKALLDFMDKRMFLIINQMAKMNITKIFLIINRED